MSSSWGCMVPMGQKVVVGHGVKKPQILRFKRATVYKQISSYPCYGNFRGGMQLGETCLKSCKEIMMTRRLRNTGLKRLVA